MVFHDKKETFEINLEQEKGEWLARTLNQIHIHQATTFNFADIKTEFETHFPDFELFWFSKPINTLRDYGLLVL